MKLSIGFMVGPGGIEPASGVYKTPALPLSYGPAITNFSKDKYQKKVRYQKPVEKRML